MNVLLVDSACSTVLIVRSQANVNFGDVPPPDAFVAVSMTGSEFVTVVVLAVTFTSGVTEAITVKSFVANILSVRVL